MYYLYHICREGDKGDYSKGYVGITKRKPEVRWKEHKKDKWFYNEYNDVIEYIIAEGSDREIKDMEESLREKVSPDNWNKRAGGVELPFNHPAAKFARYNKKKKY